jgi:predicted lipoprotein with Yx(FWY)xxD motif
MATHLRLLKLVLLGAIPCLLFAFSILALLPQSASAGMQMGYTVNVMTGSDGTMYLADPHGMPLYTYKMDVPNSGASTVSGGLLNAWPALSVQSGQQPTLDPMAMGMLGTITRSDGSTQVTYNGWPLYTFVRDTAMGAPVGNGVANFALATP